MHRRPRGRSFRGAGPFEHRANRAQIFDRAGQIAMPWPWSFQVAQPLQFVVLINHHQRDRAAQRRAMPDAGLNVDLVGFDPLPAAASVTSLATPQLDVDRVGFHGTPAGNPSIKATSALPCDSPAVQYRNIFGLCK